MKHKGSINKAIEALDCLPKPCKNGNPDYICRVSDNQLLECLDALQGLEALRDAVPDCLNINDYDYDCNYDFKMKQRDAALSKLLQEAIDEQME